MECIGLKMIKIAAKLDVFQEETHQLQMAWVKDKSLSEYINDFLEYLQLKDIDVKKIAINHHIKVLVNLQVIPEDTYDTFQLNDFDKINILFYPKITAVPFLVSAAVWEGLGLGAQIGLIFASTLINVVVMGAIGFIAYALMPKPGFPTLNKTEMDDSRVYTWDGPQTSYATGKSIPLSYGHPYVGGDIIGSIIKGVSKVYTEDFRSPDYNILESHGLPAPYKPLPYQEHSMPTPGSATYGHTFKFWEEPVLRYSKYRVWFSYPPNSALNAAYVYKRSVDSAGNPIPPVADWKPAEKKAEWPFFGMQDKKDKYIEVQTPKGQEGAEVYWELWCIGMFGAYVYGDTIAVYRTPSVTKIEYWGLGPIDEAETEEGVYNQEEGLQVLLALSDGAIAEVEHSGMSINDLSPEALQIRSEDATLAQALEIFYTRGFNAPLVEPIMTSNIVDLFSSRLLNSSEYDFELDEAGIWFEHRTISRSTEGFGVTLLFPGGLYDVKDGNDVRRKLDFVVQYGAYDRDTPPAAEDMIQVKGPSDEEQEDGIIRLHKKHVGEFKINIEVGFKEGALSPAKYLIQIKRLQGAEKSITSGWSETRIIRVQEFSFGRKLYPNTATIGLQILPSDRISGQIPNFKIPIRGRYIKVPVLRSASGNIVPFEIAHSVYNDGTESYDWEYYNEIGGTTDSLTIDTTDTMYQYTSCIPFIIYDLLTTQDLYPHILESDLVWDDFIEAAEVAWEWIGVDANSLDYEHRFEADICIDTTTDASTILNQLIALMRGKIFWIGNKLRLKVMKPENMTQLFTDADIIAGSYKEAYQPESKIPNTLEVNYYERDEKGKQHTLQVSLKDADHHKNQVIKESKSLLGVTRKSQALRTASYLLNYAASSNKVIEFQSKMGAIASVPGDVVGIQHSTITYIFGGFFRQDSSTSGGSTVFYLDAPVSLTSGETYIFKIARRTGADAGLPSDLDEYQFTAGATGDFDSITIAETISPDYATHDIWMLTVTGDSPETYLNKCRILHMVRDVKKDIVTLYCEPYDPNIYADYNIQLGTGLPPVIESPITHVPADVTDLAATQILGTYDATVTYIIPSANTPTFSSTIDSITGGDTIHYVTASVGEDSQLTSTKGLFVYDSTTGSYKGQIFITALNKNANTFIYYEDENFIGDPAVGDYIIQKREGAYLQVDHVEIHISNDGGRTFNLAGIDRSKGAGYILKSLAPMKTYYIRAESVAVTGTKGLNPPTIEFKMGLEECIPSPGHLSICGQGDGVYYFVGCDVCISWTQSASFEGAGQGIEVEAGEERAGVSESYNITGYQVWVYDNAGDLPQFVREIAVKDNEFEYTHDMNKEDQYNVFARVGKGQRKIQFRVYQVDADGNISCEPAQLSLENLAPSMSGYVPTVTSPRSGSIQIDWSQYVNDPALFSTDILGFEIWYGESVGEMTSIDVPFTEGETEAKYKITGLTAGTYIVYIIPYDCFGVGSPRSSYKSTTISVAVQGVTQVPYPPPVPQGMTGSMIIDSVDVQAGYYEVRVTTDLENDFGFEKVEDPGDPETAYLGMNYHDDLFYYNTDEDLDGYCYVTGSALNSNNSVTAIYYSTALSRWCIRVGIPSTAELATYGYEAADGVPQVGQKCAINIWAELAYTNVGGVWDSGLSTVAHAKWQHPDPASAQVNRLSHYEFKIFRVDGLLTREYNEPVDDTKVLGGYYTTDIMGIVPEKEIDVSLKLWSDVGDVGTGLYCNDIQVIKETAEYLVDQIEVNWSVASLANGSQIQVVIDNWDEYWQDERVKSYEVYACLRQWNFTGSVWEADPVAEFMALKNSGDGNVKVYDEFERTVDGHLRLVNVNDLGDSYFFLGSTEGPIFHWTNAAVSNEGGICTHYTAGSPDTCAQGCNDDLGTGDCPYGPAHPTLTCCYANSYYTPDAAADSDRTKEGINYNRYFVTLAVRTTQGRRLWYTDELGNLIWKAADFELIDRMHIADAAITTAKIGDAMINNAKIKSLSADKVWIGDYAGYAFVPFTGHCIWDAGSYCRYHGWTEDEEPPTGYFKTGDCPIGASDYPAGCFYREGEFAMTRIFAIYGQDPAHNKEFTYINGGFILTNSIRARSIQIGALPYTVDLQVTRLFDDTIEPDSYVRIKWHKGGEYQGVYDAVDPMINGRIEFANDSGFYITAGEYLFTEAALEVPDGVTVKRTMHVGYVDYIDPASHETVLFNQYDLVETTADFDYDGTFSAMRREGKIPLFSIVIIKHIPADGEQAIDGRDLIDPINIIQSDTGQFKVEIRMIAASPGTYIKNNDITTGVIHNPFWTSYFDMRHYTGYNAADNYRGHSRIVIDGPSSVYDRTMMAGHGDKFGKEWWEYTTTWPSLYGADTKLLIGRPWIDYMESQMPDIATRQEGEDLADKGYLWFYRTYDKVHDAWIGHLEIGGKLRVKDIPFADEDRPYRELLVGERYEQQEISPFHFVRTDSPGLHLYDVEPLFQTPSEGDPTLLAQIGGNEPLYVLPIEPGIGSAAHYFNTDPDTAQYTVCIDYNSKTPIGTDYDPGHASLVVIPPMEEIYGFGHSVGVTIRSPSEDWQEEAPMGGMRIYGNYGRFGLYVNLYKDIDVETFLDYGIYSSVQNDSASNLGTVGGWFRSQTGGGGRSYGVVTEVYGGEGSERVAGHFTSLDTSGGKNVGILLDVRNYDDPDVDFAHIRFVNLRTDVPSASEGEPGDLRAYNNGLFYKKGNNKWYGIIMHQVL